ncbi:V-type proton ATPase subunit E [Candidatus Methanoperedenaceae archaeon GB50]|nr:V-type proton ATPase subunit E [Candidatus Methanoperedenaceae archaeon GB50]
MSDHIKPFILPEIVKDRLFTQDSFIFKQKKQEIEHLLEKAKKEAEIIKKKAYEEGFIRGKNEGLELEKKRLSEIVHNLINGLSEINYLKEKMVEQLEKNMIILIKEISKKVILNETFTNKEIVKNLIKQALQQLIDKTHVDIKVSPQDFEYLLKFKKKFLEEVEGLKHINIIKEKKVKPGGFIIETDTEILDGRIEKRLENIFKAIEEQSEMIRNESK